MSFKVLRWWLGGQASVVISNPVDCEISGRSLSEIPMCSVNKNACLNNQVKEIPNHHNIYKSGVK